MSTMIRYSAMTSLERERHFGHALLEDSYPTDAEREVAFDTKVALLEGEAALLEPTP